MDTDHLFIDRCKRIRQATKRIDADWFYSITWQACSLLSGTRKLLCNVVSVSQIPGIARSLFMLADFNWMEIDKK